MKPTYEFDIFLSHNSADKGEIIRLKTLLTERSITSWLDKDELRPGQIWITLLEKGLENSGSVAACFGGAGKGPWHKQEMESALQMAVDEGRPVIPILLPGAGSKPKLPLFLKIRGWVDFRQGFTSEKLDELEWAITGRKPDNSTPEDSGIETKPVTPPPPFTEEELEQKLRTVFGKQFAAIRKIFAENKPFRDLLQDRFKLAGSSDESLALNLMKYLHRDFFKTIGDLLQLYAGSAYPREIVEIISAVMFLAMCPDYAEVLWNFNQEAADKERDSARAPIAIAESAERGIMSMLLSWTHQKMQDCPKVPLRAMSQEKSFSMGETTPQMELDLFKRKLMEEYQINPDAPNAEKRLTSFTKTKLYLGEPISKAFDKDGESLVERIQSDPSLRYLLLFIHVEGMTINSHVKDGPEMDFEYFYSQILVKFSTP